MSYRSLLENNWKKQSKLTLKPTIKRDFQLNKTKKRLLFITLTAGLLIFFQSTGLTSSGIAKVKKFFSVVREILSEFTLNISRDVRDTKIILWTRKSPLKYFVLKTGDKNSLIESNFNKSHPTKVLIHGFSDEGVTTWIRSFRKHYLDSGDYNVISVDWAPLAESPWYTTAAKNAQRVGKVAAEFILFLVSEGVSFDSIHVLGASLGAQVAGYVGYYTGGRLARITGLDPSGPLFHTVPACDRLDASDARFVDVIHTAGKWVGNDDILGHADFFPNSGRAPQPGCEGSESLDLSCSHFKAWRMYAESIEHKQDEFVALKCKNAEHFESGRCCAEKTLETSIMGEATPNTTRGTYFLVTNRESPLVKPAKESVKCPWINVS